MLRYHMYASFVLISYHPLNNCKCTCETMTVIILFAMPPWAIQPVHTARPGSGKHGNFSATYLDTHAQCLMQHCNRQVLNAMILTSKKPFEQASLLTSF